MFPSDSFGQILGILWKLTSNSLGSKCPVQKEVPSCSFVSGSVRTWAGAPGVLFELASGFLEYQKVQLGGEHEELVIKMAVKSSLGGLWPCLVALADVLGFRCP